MVGVKRGSAGPFAEFDPSSGCSGEPRGRGLDRPHLQNLVRARHLDHRDVAQLAGRPGISFQVELGLAVGRWVPMVQSMALEKQGPDLQGRQLMVRLDVIRLAGALGYPSRGKSLKN